MTPADTGNLKLPPELDIKAASPLAGELIGLRGNPLVLDASAVERVGGQCLQVLVSAAATWRADGQVLDVAEPSPAFLEAMEIAGLGISNLSTRDL